MSSDQRPGLAAELVPARQQLPENSSADTWWKSRSRELRSDEAGLGSHPAQLLLLGNILKITGDPRAGRPGCKASATSDLLHGTCGLSLL